MLPLSAWRDRILGRGNYASTIPIFDGALKPNQLLQHAEVVAELTDAEDVACDGNALYVADGARLLRLNGRDQLEVVLQTQAKITAIACVGGGVAVAVEGTTVHIHGGQYDGLHWLEVAGQPLRAVNSLSAQGDELLLTDGTAEHAVDQWRHDLMQKGSTGRVCSLSCANGSSRQLVRNLRYAFGAVTHPSGTLFSESWEHRLVLLGQDQSLNALVDRLPGYPSRIAVAKGGGWWVSVFACRTQLVEFVLREPEFCQRMIATIDPDLWIAPQLSSGKTFLEPLQGGGVKQMGILKPWAPPRSYGLVVRLDAQGHALYSVHSRVDGHHHGIVAVAEFGDDLYAISKGAGRLLRLDVARIEKELLQ